MKTLLGASVLVALVTAGCAAGGRPPAVSAAAAVARLELRPGPVVGQPVAAVALAQLGRRMEVFAADGKPTAGLRAGQAGSLSVQAADGSGQDNYAFDAGGLVTRHRRSYGANFVAGIWEDAVPAQP
jgi:hypothetical protein